LGLQAGLTLVVFITLGTMVMCEDGDPPSFTYWHNWASEDGVTHLTLCNYTQGWQSMSFAPGSLPLYTSTISAPANLVWFYTPAKWRPQEYYHANPKVQWGIWFTGRMLFEGGDGTQAIIEPGQVYLGDDVGSKGHHSENLADVVAVSAMIQYSGDFKGTGPCWPSNPQVL